jgi:two-component system, OmpR family, phosphate regulon response regulator PhoB
MNRPHRVLIVEDEPAIAELIAINLQHQGYLSVWAEDGEAAQRELDAVLPDLILLDWMLPGQDGVTLTRKWRAVQRTSDVPIVLLTARNEELDKVTGLDAGADDYITKPFSTVEMLARIRAVLRRPAPLRRSDQVAVGDLELDNINYRVAFRGLPLKIGPTEFKLLRYFMEHADRVHNRAHLLAKVWGDDALIEERTVDVHVMRLREALGPASAMVETVRGAGYRLVGQPIPLFQ